jgi:hypothetical protein
MATTGEQLVIYSTLTTGTALEHFLNIQYGGGGIGADDATDYAEQKVIELLFMNKDFVLIGDQGGLRGSAIAGNIYVALLTGDPGEEGSLLVEASYQGYTRVPIVRTESGWEYKDGGAKNIPILTWYPNEGADVDITHIAIMDSLIGGNMLFKKELPAPVTIATGNQAQFNYNQLTVKMT